MLRSQRGDDGMVQDGLTVSAAQRVMIGCFWARKVEAG